MTRSGALIGKTLILTGKLNGREDLAIDGRVEGDIELPENCLTVGAGGQIVGSIRAREIVVYGAVQGNLEALERVQIKRNARVVGDVRTARPVIEEEAYFKGNIETLRAEPAKQTPRAPASEAAAPPPVQATLAPDLRPGEARRG